MNCAVQGKARLSCNFTENVLWIEWHRSCCRKHNLVFEADTLPMPEQFSCAEGKTTGFANGTCLCFLASTRRLSSGHASTQWSYAV